MRQYENILVGVGLEMEQGSDPGLTGDCRNAVDRAIHIASLSGARLTLCHTLAVAPSMRDSLLETVDETDSPVARARALLQTVVDRARADGLEAESEVLFGKPWVEMVAKAERDQHDLIVVGSRQQKGIKRALFGSTANRILLDAPCHVLVVQGPGSENPARIVIATDLTDLGLEVLRHGLQLAQEFGGEVDVVYGVENWYEDQWDRAGYARAAIEREHEREKKEAKAELDARVAKVVAELGVPQPRVHVETGSPEATIWQTAQDDKAGLVIMGIVGRKGLDRFWVGDTARRILPELPCSLLVIKPVQGH